MIIVEPSNSQRRSDDQTILERGPSKYVRVAHCLYRHSVSGLYYGCKKMHGMRRERSFGTTDRQIAERRLKDWIRTLEVVDREVERTRLRQLLARFAKITHGKAAKTRAAAGDHPPADEIMAGGRRCRGSAH